MQLKAIYPNGKIFDNSGKIALSYGPLILCIEGADNPVDIPAIRISSDFIKNAVVEKDDLTGLKVTLPAFVAQNMGAKKPKRAQKALLSGIMTSFAVGCVIGAFTFVKGDLLASIFSSDVAVILAAHDYLKAYAIDCLLVAVMFCMVGFFNGLGKTVFVMIQGIVGALGVRVPVVLLMSSLPNTSLFLIGLGTPASTFAQIVLCVGFMYYLKRKGELD